MERDCYQVEVLYYLNPHLIWVEVIEKSQQDFVFEQIGVYGIVPFETTINNEGEGLKSQRCVDWVGASTVLMKKVFYDAEQVWFRPTHIDRRTSIFDDNIHKYGEIIIKMKDGKPIELSKVLMDSGFALFDICLFHKELSLGNLKTKLNHSQTLDIIKHLENDTKTSSKKHRKTSVKKQTTVFQAANDLGSLLTKTNLRKHDHNISRKIDAIMEKKSKDFDRCKDVDEVSLGRASRLKHTGSDVQKSEKPVVVKETSKVPLFLKKKLELTKRQKAHPNEPLQVLMATKQYLEANATTINDFNASENLEPNRKTKEDVLNNATEIGFVDEYPSKNVYNAHSGGSENSKHSTSNEYEKKMNARNKIEHDSFVDVKMNNFKTKRDPNRRPKKAKMKIPEYDIETEVRVAYGPPGIATQTLPLKIVPKKTIEDVMNMVSSTTDNCEDPPKSQEMYADVDSHLDFKIPVTTELKERFRHQFKNDDKPNTTFDQQQSDATKSKFALIQKKLQLFRDKQSDSSVTSTSDTTSKDSSSDDVKPKKNDERSDDEDVSDLVEKINSEYKPKSLKAEIEARKKTDVLTVNVKNNVNPFKNIDSSLSVFVDKLVTPVLMVHNKMNYPIEPCSNIRDVNFNTHIHVLLKNLGVARPMMLQMVSWPVILRGYSLYMIGPMGSGKTFGYLPAVCRLITDDSRTEFIDSVGPTCIIVCATAQSVSEVEHYAKMFLGVDEKVVSCFAGVDELHLTTSLLNGCNLFICTPTVLVRLLQLTDFGIDLRRLSTFVLEDCERLSEVYASEVKYSLLKIREMLKSRVNKELKVQFIVASRVWCDFMETLAKKTPNSVVCIGAFQECVLYSKANTSVEFLKKENKISKVLEFLKDIDATKKTVIVCRSNDEVEALLKVLTKNKYVVFACNETMTVEDLYNLNKTWEDYQEPLLAPVLLCCDGNLNHLNVSDAHYLLHYSLPHLFSMFCKRFSVLNDNYASIFKEENENVKIKVFLEESNTEQLPKIVNFIKRCTDQMPEFLDKVCGRVLQEKDVIKAKKLVPICDSILAFGECPDFWNCQERHAVFKEYDEPKDWMPRNGVVTFKILHYHTPVHYSVRLLSNVWNGDTKKYPQAYSTLSLKMGMYFSKENNRQLHGEPKVGDVCAVSVKQNFFVRCQVLKVLNRYNNGTPNCVLINLIDEEKLEKSRDIYLFHLPDELKSIETHIVQVRLANVCPKDKDVTFSNLARDSLKKLTANDDDLYLRAHIALTVGNCILVDTLEACQELTSLNETVVMHNLKKELLNTHAIANPEHVGKLEKLCVDFVVHEEETAKPVQSVQKERPKPQWAHLENGDMSAIFFASAESPEMFFIRLVKFESCMNLLLKDIASYIEGKPASLKRVTIGEIVLAKFPDDAVFERARIDDIINENMVKCFFVDQGEWIDVEMKDLVAIPSRFVSQLPFQAIECRLVAVRPAGDGWTDFGTNWFYDTCFDSNGDPKILHVRQFTKEDSQHTDGRKYGVVMIDTSTEQDVVINQLMIDLNLAQENGDEAGFLQELDLNQKCSDDKVSECSSDENELEDLPAVSPSNSIVPVNTIEQQVLSAVHEEVKTKPSLENVFMKQPIRSVPLVDSDNESTDSWDIVNPQELVALLKGSTGLNIPQGNNSSVHKENKAGNHNNVNKTKTDSNAASVKEIIDESLKQERPAKPSQDLVEDKSSVEVTSHTKGTLLEKLRRKANVSSNQLDSDDLSSTEGSQLSAKSQEMPKAEKIPISFLGKENVDLNIVDELRKPKLLWRQNKASVSIKIQLIGAQNYNLKLEQRSLKFDAYCNDVKYGFTIELYGVVEDLIHADKGQYILVKLNKIIKKNWLSLTKDSAVRKWIVYDVDCLDTSSDEEDDVRNTLAEMAKVMLDKHDDTDSDDDFLDDINYEYKRHD